MTTFFAGSYSLMEWIEPIVSGIVMGRTDEMLVGNRIDDHDDGCKDNNNEENLSGKEGEDETEKISKCKAEQVKVGDAKLVQVVAIGRPHRTTNSPRSDSSRAKGNNPKSGIQRPMQRTESTLRFFNNIVNSYDDNEAVDEEELEAIIDTSATNGTNDASHNGYDGDIDKSTPTSLLLSDGRTSILAILSNEPTRQKLCHLAQDDMIFDNNTITKGCVIRIQNWEIDTIQNCCPVESNQLHWNDRLIQTYCGNVISDSTIDDPVLVLYVKGTIDILGGHGLAVVGRPNYVMTTLDVRRCLQFLSYEELHHNIDSCQVNNHQDGDGIPPMNTAVSGGEKKRTRGTHVSVLNEDDSMNFNDTFDPWQTDQQENHRKQKHGRIDSISCDSVTSHENQSTNDLRIAGVITPTPSTLVRRTITLNDSRSGDNDQPYQQPGSSSDHSSGGDIQLPVGDVRALFDPSRSQSRLEQILSLQPLAPPFINDDKDGTDDIHQNLCRLPIGTIDVENESSTDRKGTKEHGNKKLKQLFSDVLQSGHGNCTTAETIVSESDPVSMWRKMGTTNDIVDDKLTLIEEVLSDVNNSGESETEDDDDDDNNSNVNEEQKKLGIGNMLCSPDGSDRAALHDNIYEDDNHYAFDMEDRLDANPPLIHPVEPRRRSSLKAKFVDTSTGVGGMEGRDDANNDLDDDEEEDDEDYTDEVSDVGDDDVSVVGDEESNDLLLLSEETTSEDLLDRQGSSTSDHCVDMSNQNSDDLFVGVDDPIDIHSSTGNTNTLFRPLQTSFRELEKLNDVTGGITDDDDPEGHHRSDDMLQPDMFMGLHVDTFDQWVHGFACHAAANAAGREEFPEKLRYHHDEAILKPTATTESTDQIPMGGDIIRSFF